MKHRFFIGMILGILALLPLAAQAQAPYAGGKGDGYSSWRGEIRAVGNDWVRIFPSPVQRGDDLTIRTFGIVDAQVVTLYDAQGKELLRETWSDAYGSTNYRIATSELAPGCYLVRVQAFRGEFAQKVIVWAP